MKDDDDSGEEKSFAGDVPPGWNYHHHRWKQLGARGRKIIHSRLYELLYNRTWVARSIKEEERNALVYDILWLLELDLGALDVFTPAREEQEAMEAESKARGPGRPRKWDQRGKWYGMTAEQVDYPRKLAEARERRILEAGVTVKGISDEKGKK